jgi:hypothetical protein
MWPYTDEENDRLSNPQPHKKSIKDWSLLLGLCLAPYVTAALLGVYLLK